jgi:hypothetical protein
MSDGAGAVSQCAPLAEPDGAAPDGEVAGEGLADPPALQAAASVPATRIAAHSPVKDRVRGMATA